MIDRLAERIAALAPADQRQVARIVTALETEIRETALPGSSIATFAFLEEFRARLQAHHALNSTRLSKGAFEDAYAAASEAAGCTVRRVTSATQRFFDVIADGRRISLKTEGAKSLHADYLHISKLCEAAWIQDMRSARARELRTKELFETLLQAVDQFVMLRAYPTRMRYELVELPKHLLEPLLDAPTAAFASDGPTVPVGPADVPDLLVRLDRSDAKVTLAKIRKSRCLVHATWDL